MRFLENNCAVFPHTEMVTFSCGDKDLDDFFNHDAIKYEQQLLGKTYCFRLDNDNSVVVCAFTLSNSSIDARNLPNNRRRKLTEYIPHEKTLSSYPATLIGRLGVNREFGGKGIGTSFAGRACIFYQYQIPTGYSLVIQGLDPKFSIIQLINHSVIRK